MRLYYKSLYFEAKEANVNAINAVQKCLKKSANDKEALDYLKTIEQSKQLINNKIEEIE